MIVVLADDLSGAAELAGAALRHGLSAELQTAFASDTDAEVVCVATDTRSLPAESAARCVAACARSIAAAQPVWLFKKCDSVLRGPVLAEARAVAHAAGKSRIVILSANPSRGRIIRNGIYFVDGVPLHETVFAQDPEHPRQTSRLTELLGGDLTGVETPDVQSAADIRRHAATVDNNTLAVGGADFFAALLQARVAPRATLPQSGAVPDQAGQTLVVCGSAASWTQRRAEALAHGVPVFALPHAVDTIVQALRTSRRVLVGIGDGPATCARSSATLVQLLADTVAGILRTTTPTRLLLEGGATTAAVLRAAGWTRLRAREVSAQGIGVLRPTGPVAPLLFIKPGSYAWPPEIWPG